MNHDALIDNFALDIISVIDGDGDNKSKSKELSKLIHGVLQVGIGEDGIFAAFDKVCEHFGNRDVLMNILPDKLNLEQDGFVINSEHIPVLLELSHSVNRLNSPIFLKVQEDHEPVAIMPLSLFNLMMNRINPKGVVDPSNITCNAEPIISKSSDKVQ